MRSRELPLCRTLRFARPPGVTLEEREGIVIFDAPGCRDAWSAHRLELDAPPTDPAPFLARWQAAHGTTGVARRTLCWETPLDVPWTRVAERYAPTRMWGMRRAGPPPEVPAPLPIRPAGDALGRVIAVAAGQHPAFGPSYATFLGWWYRGLAAVGGTCWVAWDGDAPVAAATLVEGPEEARFQDVWTLASHRRRGLAAALIAAALADHHARRPAAPVVIGAVVDGPAEGLYRRLGFRAVSRWTELSDENPAAC